MTTAVLQQNSCSQTVSNATDMFKNSQPIFLTEWIIF